MAKLEVKKTDVNEKSYRVIAPCPHGRFERVFIKQFNKEIDAPVFVGSDSCRKCEHFKGYVDIDCDPLKKMYIKCDCGSIWQRLKRSLKSCLQWLER